MGHTAPRENDPKVNGGGCFSNATLLRCDRNGHRVLMGYQPITETYWPRC